MTRSGQDPVDEQWQRAFRWVERELGGKLVRYERQARWRPAWLLDLERDGDLVPLYFRGDRGSMDHGVYPLEHEMRVLQVLEQHDLPVPHVYGFCEEPRGILMDRMPGRANLGTAESEAEREAVLDHYMELLARLHQIDCAAFEAIGIRRPRSAEELALGDFEIWDRAYRRQKRRPEPLIEFVIGWVRRNIPQARTRATPIASDSGQFLFDQGRVTSLLDLELACLGDPVADLGNMRGRDLAEPLGDLSRGVRSYERASGERVDRRALDYHTVRFGVCTPMSVAHVVADPAPDVSLVQYLAWYYVWPRTTCLEVIADLQGIELEPPEIPPDVPTRHSVSHAQLCAALEAAHPEAEHVAYQLDNALRTAQYLERADQLGPQIEASELDDIARLVGHRPTSWAQADAELEEWISGVGPERDAELVRYLYRRCLRHEAILYPALRELQDASLQRIEES